MIREYDIPRLPGHHWLFGDLITIGKTMSKYPSDTHGQWMPYFIMRDYPEIEKAGICYFDLWPISWPMCSVFHPDIAAQFTQESSQPKHDLVRNEFRPLTGLKDLVLSEGNFWKKWRAIFNPGFSIQNVMALVPSFVEEVTVWKQYLEKTAQTGETIRLEDSVMKVTCDIIGHAVLGKSLGIQTGRDDIIYPALKNAIGLLVSDWSPSQWGNHLSPFRMPKLWYYNRILHNELHSLISKQLTNHESIDGPKTINKLAVKTYLKDFGGRNDMSDDVHSEFLDITVQNLKIFLFAGHDTTATTLCYIYYYLYHHPDVLKKVLAEHDSVFSTDLSKTPQQISDNPLLLNQLPYTTAVIKECLRLEPPVGSVRAGSPNLLLTQPETGQRLPTDKFMLFSTSKALHRNEKYWSKPNEFIPERWLDTNALRKNLFRPFELGPRSCIGQELAQTELKLILVMTARELEIVPMYDETDPYILGSQAYQVNMPGELTAHPKKGLPATIRLRKKSMSS
ncbi:hypothetical protein V493_01799 [Pseudogymnoascus sp. VKM F-4281 (FW-2241)]|nr:hypothetical protein V493_01799 [Pseudogymnoascus sp. VKM F-4281 (FW-2241)]